jgi:hypothetical protein
MLYHNEEPICTFFIGVSSNEVNAMTEYERLSLTLLRTLVGGVSLYLSSSYPRPRDANFREWQDETNGILSEVKNALESANIESLALHRLPQNPNR